MTPRVAELVAAINASIDANRALERMPRGTPAFLAAANHRDACRDRCIALTVALKPEERTELETLVEIHRAECSAKPTES